MDAGIADTINRRWAAALAAHLDAVDANLREEMILAEGSPWYLAEISETLMGESPDRAWLACMLAAAAPDLSIEGSPAEGDWENLFTYIRAEIQARRDADSSPARVAEIPVRGMV